MTPPTPPEPTRPISHAEGQGGEPRADETKDTDPGPARTRSTRRTRRDRAQETVRGHKLHLNDALFERLQLLAIQRRTTVSAVASDILERNLPKLRIERDA